MPGNVIPPNALIEGSIRCAYEELGWEDKIDSAVAAAYATDLSDAAWLLAEASDILCDLLFIRAHRIAQLEKALQAHGVAVPPEDDPESVL